MTHYGDGPAGTTAHRGDREDCSGPDCGPQRRGVTPHLVEIDEAHRLPVSPYMIQDPSALQSHVEEIMGHPRTVREVIEADPRVKEVFGPRPARRGTTNGNARGGSEDRRKRREWLVATYRADVDVSLILGRLVFPVPYGTEGAVPACRCYRCGRLLTVDTVTVDRIVPGCQGGTYRRSNIRPACGGCNSSTGATTRRKGERT